ncbi:MAG: FAD-dependent oxidoreductase, partial [Candidatus Izemoplasmatales bacterium]
MIREVNIIGGGLAGSEAAYQLAKRNIKVNLYEVKTIKRNDAQSSDYLAELVCSNSFRSNDVHNAAGLMKEELRRLDSLLIKTADRFEVPAGSALAVDREGFSQEITNILKGNKNINIIEEEIEEIPSGFTIVASGPLTTSKLGENIRRFIGDDMLY